jgi:hypothetical protein
MRKRIRGTKGKEKEKIKNNFYTFLTVDYAFVICHQRHEF